MPSITKHARGWRAFVSKKGIRRSKVCATKQAAKDWAVQVEYEIANAKKIASSTPFSDVLMRYAREVSPTKKGEAWETIRLKKLSKDKIGRIAIINLTAQDLADWRDRRLGEVSAGSVLREINLMSSVLTQARREWGMISDNPMRDVRKPQRPKERDRLPTSEELERISLVAGSDLTTAQARAFHAFLFGCETAMRAGEIVSLTWDNVSLDRRFCHLPMTKNGHPRDVPLSPAAIDILGKLPKTGDLVFDLNSRQLDVLWRKVRDKAAVEDLTFHDSRAAALTKLARKLDVLDLAKVSGHRDLRVLLNTYYREDPESIADRLAD